ncbi:DNA-binding transcriptional regulator, LysR family [Tistlia consotensis]|uniref:Transcriptional regulator, LysR family n=1 Tax=Tistlia consotensis USBA 355 TaxID=560819 RepID=A0A1Y6BLK1_9PROT|nr:LysR family transcriptional regulator [Tistlia consotensis]SMF09804.1 transcriptional regulator, LysR family [Tistlia consotensis USBA 355]SNR34242.1 DNA-binding transcriptional regulator, LysR family [Tistlia consotensis]
MDNVSEMEVFVRVVQAKSFSEAARSLGLSPSAVSKQIGRLEDRLGARLLNRTTRQLSLTEIGAAFHERAERIVNDIAEAERAVSHLHGAPRGQLKVNAPVAFGIDHLAPLLPGFMAENPEVSVDLSVNDRFVDLVEEGIDVALRIGELADSSLIARRLAANRRVVCAAPSYLERRGTPASTADLKRHNCLVYTYRQQRRDWHFDGPGGHELVTVNGDLETNNAQVLRMAALGGLGIVLLPLWLVGPDLTEGRLIEVLPQYHVPDSSIYAVWPAGRHLSPKVRAFVDHIAAEIGELAKTWERH